MTTFSSRAVPVLAVPVVVLALAGWFSGAMSDRAPVGESESAAQTVVAAVSPIVLPEGVNHSKQSGPPPVVPAPDPELAAGLAEAAAVEWEVPAERRDLSDGAEALPGSEARPVVIEGCRNQLVQLLAGAGFRGEDLREAWAIAMRETGGREELGPGHPDFNGADYGLFQFNKPSFASQPWWNDAALVNGEYNAKVAYYLSRGGRTWYLWGLDGRGRTNPVVYASIWTPQQIEDWITKPYQRFYAQFPC